MEEAEILLRNAMEHHGAAVYRLALCRMQSVQDAEDVYQDVFLRLLGQEASAWDGEHLRAWLLRCTVNRCHDLHRFRLRRPVLALADLPETAAEADSGAAELWDAVARLPEKLRVPIHWTFRRPRSAPGSAGPEKDSKTCWEETTMKKNDYRPDGLCRRHGGALRGERQRGAGLQHSRSSLLVCRGRPLHRLSVPGDRGEHSNHFPCH